MLLDGEALDFLLGLQFVLGALRGEEVVVWQLEGLLLFVGEAGSVDLLISVDCLVLWRGVFLVLLWAELFDLLVLVLERVYLVDLILGHLLHDGLLLLLRHLLLRGERGLLLGYLVVLDSEVLGLRGDLGLFLELENIFF